MRGYVTDIFTERALDFVGRRRQRPFFLELAHKALHPDILQRDDGSVVPIGEGRFVAAERHKTLYARAPVASPWQLRACRRGASRRSSGASRTCHRSEPRR